MKLLKSYFPYITCDVESSGIPVGPDGEPTGAAVEDIRISPGSYLLIENHLVPGAFIDRVANLFGRSRGFVYGQVLTPREMCGEKFWETLDKKERRVAGHILLLLIEQGCIDVAYMHDPD